MANYQLDKTKLLALVADAYGDPRLTTLIGLGDKLTRSAEANTHKDDLMTYIAAELAASIRKNQGGETALTDAVDDLLHELEDGRKRLEHTIEALWAWMATDD